jgi:hypothetical protein
MTTLQIADERKAALERLKVGGMTYDDVIRHLLLGIDEDVFRREALAWESDMAKKIRNNPKNRPVL